MGVSLMPRLSALTAYTAKGQAVRSKGIPSGLYLFFPAPGGAKKACPTGVSRAGMPLPSLTRGHPHKPRGAFLLMLRYGKLVL